MTYTGINATPDTITVHVNGQPQAVSAGSSLQQALAYLAAESGEDAAGVMATALNGRHIARALRAQTLLADGDHITTFEPITGG